MKHAFRFRLLTLGTSCLLGHLAQAQNGILEKDTTRKGAITFLRLTTNGPASRSATDLGLTLRSLLKLQPQDELRAQNSNTDELGLTHTRHNQYYKGVPVEYGVYVAHTRKGIIETLNGEVIKIGAALDVTTKLSEQQALAKALASVGASIYRWQLPAAEKDLQTLTHNPAASYYPKGELLVSSDEKVTVGARLAYKFVVYAQQPASAAYVYVDAHTGEAFRQVPVMMDNNITGTVPTRYSGTQTITFDQVNSSSFRLRETGRGSGASCGYSTANIETHTGNATTDLTSSTSNWSTDVALDAHWAAEKTYDYFRSKFCRNSFDGLGHTFVAITHAGAQDQSSWDTTLQTVNLFDGKDRCNPLTSLDIVAHEFAHGYTQSMVNPAKLSTEPQALNEGLSDIWGACVENFAAPTKQTWLIGEDVMKSGYSCFRNLANPNSGIDPYFPSLSGGPGGYPDVYQGAYYDNRDAYHADPHINASIISHCFYLLAVGGYGANSSNTYYSVQGIGIEKAAQILFRAEEQHYITSNSGFSEARTAMIQSATDYYGSQSCEVVSVANAWFAVGVGARAPQIYIASGPAQICAGDAAVFTTNAANVTWSATPSNLFNTTTGSGSQFSTSAPYGVQGTGTITISSCGRTDSRTIRIGYPEPTGTYSCGYSPSYGSSVTLGTYQNLGITNPNGADVGMFLNSPYTFNFTSNLAGLYLTQTTGTYTHFILKPGQGVTITATSTNAPCSIVGRYAFITPSGGYSLAAAPNPVSADLTVTAVDDTSAANAPVNSSAPPFDADLYDSYGNKVKTLHSDHGKAVFNVRNLPNGLYNLRAGIGKKAIVEHIEITH